MFDFLSALLSDKKGDVVFTCFSFFHVVFILAFVALVVFSCLYIRNKSGDRTRAVELFINIALGLYVLDFFLMPFAYGKIDIEKLPFHVCTAMCVMCFFSRHHVFFKKYKLQLAMLGFLSNLIYLIYPAGVMWHAVHPLSYRVIQTLAFHGMMMVYGALVLIFESQEFRWKKCYKDFIVILAMTGWACLGNALYNSEAAIYNWFFVVRDPFYILPERAAPYIMPILNVGIFFIAELLIYAVFSRFAIWIAADRRSRGPRCGAGC